MAEGFFHKVLFCLALAARLSWAKLFADFFHTKTNLVYYCGCSRGGPRAERPGRNHLPAIGPQAAQVGPCRPRGGLLAMWSTDRAAALRFALPLLCSTGPSSTLSKRSQASRNCAGAVRRAQGLRVGFTAMLDMRFSPDRQAALDSQVLAWERQDGFILGDTASESLIYSPCQAI